MINFETIGQAVLVSYNTAAIKNYLLGKGENLNKIEARGYFVETYFEEDDLNLVMLDLREGQEEAKLISFQDFYINTDSLVEIHDSFKAKTKDNAVVDVFKLAAHKLLDIITMVPTFQEYYYRHNLAYPSKAFIPKLTEYVLEKAA